MSDPVLTPKDKVSYVGGNSYLDMIGFTTEKEYSLIQYDDGGLLIQSAIRAFDLPLVMPDGKPTEFFKSFKKYLNV